ncbi:MAG: MBL fold metallo-hydrolase [Actinomycetota bacterium]|nr:MBL fold metallo-hydrolase [Actinomycetota bacterium]
MFVLRVVQAQFGDCLIIEFGSAGQARHLLVDGGPPGTYLGHLERELQRIAASGGKVDLAVLSHVDNDHVVGLVDLLTQLRDQRANNQPETITIDGLWHNSFALAIDPTGDLAPRLRAMVAAAGPQAMGQTGIAVAGIGEGDRLRRDALTLGLPINTGFVNQLVCVDDAPAPVTLDNLTLRVVGPTRANFDELKEKWEEWLDAHEDVLATGDPLLAAMADRSVPNLSSIMLLAEADNKRLLLTGDGRGDHLLTGLETAGLLEQDGSIHVDVLKVPHHGSDRNATRKFFRTVTADTYVFSANGLHGNPDLATLIWIVEAAREQTRAVELVLTNRTPSSDKLLEEYPHAEYGYQLTTMPVGADAVVVGIAA